MLDEDTFITFYCLIAGVSEAAARSACIMFDALHSGVPAASLIPGLALVAKLNASAARPEPAMHGSGSKAA